MFAGLRHGLIQHPTFSFALALRHLSAISQLRCPHLLPVQTSSQPREGRLRMSHSRAIPVCNPREKGLSSSVWAAITKCHSLCGSNNRRLLMPALEAQGRGATWPLCWPGLALLPSNFTRVGKGLTFYVQTHRGTKIETIQLL